MATTLVGIVLALTVWGLLHLPEVRGPDPPGRPKTKGFPWGTSGSDTEEARRRWQKFWERLEQPGPDLPEPPRLASSETDRARRPAGDTAFMRYRDLWTTVRPTVRQQFRVAAISSNLDHKLTLLQILAQDDDAQVRFRALVEIARVSLRSRAFGEAERGARAALALAGIDRRLRADAYFVLGVAALEREALQSAEEALAQAVDHDPGFWDARWAHLTVVSRQLERPRQRTADCLDRTRWLIEHLGVMPQLAQDRTQFRDIADAFAQSAARPNAAIHLVVGLGYLWGGDHTRARTALAAAQQARGSLPRQCEALLLERVETLLTQLPE